MLLKHIVEEADVVLSAVAIMAIVICRHLRHLCICIECRIVIFTTDLMADITKEVGKIKLPMTIKSENNCTEQYVFTVDFFYKNSIFD